MQKSKENFIVTVNNDYLINQISQSVAYIRRVQRRQSRRSEIDQVEEQNKMKAIANTTAAVKLIRAGLKKNECTSLNIRGVDWYGFIAEGGFELMMEINKFNVKN